MNQFAKTLRELTEKSGKSVYELEKVSGVDAAYIRRLMTGRKRNPSATTQLRLAFALVSCPELIRQHPEMAQALSTLMAAHLSDAVAGLAGDR